MYRNGMLCWTLFAIVAWAILAPPEAEACWFRFCRCHKHGSSSYGRAPSYAPSNAPASAPQYQYVMVTPVGAQNSIFSTLLPSQGEQLAEDILKRLADRLRDRIGSGGDIQPSDKSQLDRIEALVKSIKSGQDDIEGRLINNAILDERMGEKVYEMADKVDTIHKQTYLEEDGSPGNLLRMMLEIQRDMQRSRDLDLEPRVTQLEQDILDLKQEVKSDIAKLGGNMTTGFQRLEQLIANSRSQNNGAQGMPQQQHGTQPPHGTQQHNPFGEPEPPPMGGHPAEGDPGATVPSVYRSSSSLNPFSSSYRVK